MEGQNSNLDTYKRTSHLSFTQLFFLLLLLQPLNFFVCVVLLPSPAVSKHKCMSTSRIHTLPLDGLVAYIAPVSASHLKSYALSFLVLLCSLEIPVDCIEVPSLHSPPDAHEERGICWFQKNTARLNRSISASLYAEFKF